MNTQGFETTVDYILQLPPAEIAFLQAVIEGYEGHAGISTIDPALGITRVTVAPFATDLLEKVFYELNEYHIPLEILEVIGKRREGL